MTTKTKTKTKSKSKIIILATATLIMCLHMYVQYMEDGGDCQTLLHALILGVRRGKELKKFRMHGDGKVVLIRRKQIIIMNTGRPTIIPSYSHHEGINVQVVIRGWIMSVLHS